MSRLQKKCFIGATGFHLFLLVLLFVGPAFFVADKVEDAPVLTFVAKMATDAKVSGGGTPAPRQPTPQPQPQPQVQTQPEPQPQVQPQPKPRPQPVPEPDPPKLATPKLTKEDPDSDEPAPKPKKHQVKISDTVVKIKDRSKPTRDSKSSAQTAATTERAQQVASALKHIESNLSSTTTVEMPEGPGGGGVSYANYGQIVRKIYAEGWIPPPQDEMTDDQATIVVSVTIARNGRILSSRIVQPSGSAAANRSIQSTLDRISNIGVSFPAGAKESERTFRMTFNLKAKTSLG